MQICDNEYYFQKLLLLFFKMYSVLSYEIIYCHSIAVISFNLCDTGIIVITAT